MKNGQVVVRLWNARVFLCDFFKKALGFIDFARIRLTASSSGAEDETAG